MKNVLILIAMVCALSQGVFADSRVCDQKKAEAVKLLDRCKAMERGTSEFKQCASSYNLLKKQVETACAGGLDEGQLQTNIKQWDELAKQCKGRQNSRCASALQNLGHFTYQLEEMQNLKKMAAFEQEALWCADRDNKPEKCKNLVMPKPNHSKSLSHFIEYIEKYPKESRTPNVLFQASFILEVQGDEDKAYEMRKRLVEQFSDNGLVPRAWLRMGEYFFNKRNFREAIKAYEKVTGFANLTGKEAALAMYHKAESHYNLADYEKAAQIYYDYIVGSDAGKYPADLRQEAMDFMAASFSDLDDGVVIAGRFLKKKKVAFEDSLYFRIGMKNKEHDRLPEAVQSFKYLLDISPDYVDAPLADIALVEILVTQQKFDEAQEQRWKVVKRYDRNSSWFRKNQNQKASVDAANGAIRSAMLDIPQYHHAQASRITKEGDIEKGKQEYKKAIDAYNAFLQRYAGEPSWDEYRVHINLALVYHEMNQFSSAAKMFNWIDDVDTTRYGRRPQHYGELLKKSEAAYNAVLAMDKEREEARKSKAGDDPVRAYALPETKAYFQQIDRFMSKWGKEKEAAELAYNAAVVHYEAKQYKTSIQVLSKLKTEHPKHQYVLLIGRMLAQSHLEDGNLDDAEKEFTWLHTQYSKVRETRNDSLATEIDKSIAAVLFQKADRSVKAGQFDQGAKAFLALVERYPVADFSDRAIFEAGAAFESGKNYKQAAQTFMLMPRKYSKSPLTIRAILRAAINHKNDKNPQEAARTFLFITDNFPQDSMAFQAIAFAASTYDSIPDKKMAAQTFEMTHKRYPKNEKTPGFLYNACLTYDEAKLPDEAIRCSRLLVQEYPKSSYALDAAYSIPIAYRNAKKWDLAAEAYLAFAKQYTGDKEKLIAANFGAAQAYMELKQTDKAAAQFKATLDVYEKFGLQIANADPAVPAEASYWLGEFEKSKMDAITLKGNEKAKAKSIQDLVKILQGAMAHFAKSAEYASEKWTFRATNQMGGLFVTMAAKIREQELSAKGKEEQFVERITIVQQLPTYYEQARPIFQKNIDLARDQGFYNDDVIKAEEGYIEMYYQDCAVFFEVADAFRAAPLPDRKAIIQDYMAEGLVKEDAEMQADDFLTTYKEELEGKAATAAEGGLPKCATGIKASAHYQIQNSWTQKLFDRVKMVNPEHEVLSTQIVKFDPSTLFRDPIYFRTKARIEQISASEVISAGERFKTYNEIISAAKAESGKLREELQALRVRVAPPPAPAMPQ